MRRRRLVLLGVALVILVGPIAWYRTRQARHKAMQLRVQRLLDEKRYGEAIELSTDLMQRTHWEGLLVGRSVAYLALNQNRSAREDLDRAIATYPSWSAAWANRGDLNYREKRYDDALRDFNRSLELKPYAFAYYGRGLVYDQRRNLQAALADYTAALAIDPRHPDGYERRGRLYAQLKQNDRAMDDFTHAIALDPNQGRLYVFRAAVRSSAKQYPQALEDANKAVALLPDNAWAHLTRGFAYSDLKQHEQALSDFDAVVRLYPKWGVGYYWRGWAHDHLGHRGEAKADWQQALLLGDDETTKRARAKLREQSE